MVADKPDLRYKASIIFPLDEMVSAGLIATLGISCPLVGFHFSQQNLGSSRIRYPKRRSRNILVQHRRRHRLTKKHLLKSRHEGASY